MSRVEQSIPPGLERIRALHPYQPGHQPQGGEWVKLNTNESPYPPTPAVDQALHGFSGARLRLYPDPRSMALREEVARLHGWDPARVIIGNGSDDLLNLIMRAYVGEAGTCAYFSPGYSLYPVLAGIAGSRCRELLFERSFRLPVEALADCPADVCFLTSPNAPTGVGFSPDEIAACLQVFAGVLVVDEAYGEFADSTALSLLSGYDRIIVTRTLSKAYGLAGLRLGYALAHPGLIDLLDRVRDSYNVNALSQAAGLAALRDQEYLAGTVRKIRQTRDRYANLWRSRGWFVYPSQTNFLFVEPKTMDGRSGPEIAAGLHRHLQEQHILVRYFGSHSLTAAFLRITVGSEPQMERLEQVLRTWHQTSEPQS